MPSRKRYNLSHINSQKVIAISALIIGILTVFIYIYQARIMSKQHQDSVWPYVFTGRSIDKDLGLTLTIYNKGIGPALVTSVLVEHDNKFFYSWRELLDYWKIESVNFTCSGVPVLGASEEQIIFQVQNYDMAKLVWEKMNNVDVKIFYCSIHDKCWEASSEETIERKKSKKKSIKC
ncbi:MAG: hypothetical protein WBA74_11075 [Cyclobacteriaceae bacterium]